MKISSLSSRLRGLEQFLVDHENPCEKNHNHFVDSKSHKVVSSTSLLKQFESLAKAMQKKGEKLDEGDCKRIYTVLYYIRQDAQGKLRNRYLAPTKRTDEFLHKRCDQVESLLTRLGIRAPSTHRTHRRAYDDPDRRLSTDLEEWGSRSARRISNSG